MVTIEEIQAVYYMVAATGVLVAAGYYILNLRVSQKNQELNLKAQQQTLDTRQIQLLKEFDEDLTELYSSADSYVKMTKEKWKDFDDYMKKYGARNDPEGSNYRLKYWRRLNFYGLMVRDGVIDIDTFTDYLGDMAPLFWDKYRDVILEMRRRYHNPLWMNGFEYLANEVNQFRVRNGWGVKTPDDSLYSALVKAGE